VRKKIQKTDIKSKGKNNQKRNFAQKIRNEKMKFNRPVIHYKIKQE